MRSCLITVTIGTVDAGQYRDGVVNKHTRKSDQMLESIVERQADEEIRFTGSQSRFVGFVDEWTIEFGDDDTVELKCRDLSALLKDERLPAGVAIDLTKPIMDGIKDLIERKDDDGKQLFPSAIGMNQFFGTPEEFAIQGFKSGAEGKGPIPQDSIAETHKSRGGKKSKAMKPISRLPMSSPIVRVRS